MVLSLPVSLLMFLATMVLLAVHANNLKHTFSNAIRFAKMFFAISFFCLYQSVWFTKISLFIVQPSTILFRHSVLLRHTSTIGDNTMRKFLQRLGKAYSSDSAGDGPGTITEKPTWQEQCQNAKMKSKMKKALQKKKRQQIAQERWNKSDGLLRNTPLPEGATTTSANPQVFKKRRTRVDSKASSIDAPSDSLSNNGQATATPSSNLQRQKVNKAGSYHIEGGSVFVASCPVALSYNDVTDLVNEINATSKHGNEEFDDHEQDKVRSKFVSPHESQPGPDGIDITEKNARSKHNASIGGITAPSDGQNFIAKVSHLPCWFFVCPPLTVFHFYIHPVGFVLFSPLGKRRHQVKNIERTDLDRTK